MAELIGGGDNKKSLEIQRQGLQAQRDAIKEAAKPKGLIANEGVAQQAEVIRRARLAALERKGRASTVLSQGSTTTPAYSNTVLGA